MKLLFDRHVLFIQQNVNSLCLAIVVFYDIF